MENSPYTHKFKVCKLKVKLWEKQFKKEHNRLPSKYDIREAPNDIRHSYKVYYKLKTAYLEDTLQGALSEDEMDILDYPEMNSEDQNDNYDGPKLPTNISMIIESNQTAQDYPKTTSTENSEVQNNKYFESAEDCVLNINAWSFERKQKANEISEKIKPTKDERKINKSNLNLSLFKSSSYSRRNPRKSFSRSISETNVKSGQQSLICQGESSDNVLPDLETILTQKNRDSPSISVISSNPILSDKFETITCKRKIDKGWLQRNIPEDTSMKQKSLNVTSANSLQTKFYESNLITSNTTMRIIEKHSEVSKSDKSGSESVISDSESELNDEEHRHIVKRRKKQLKGKYSADLSCDTNSVDIQNNSVANVKDYELHSKLKSKRQIYKEKQGKFESNECTIIHGVNQPKTATASMPASDEREFSENIKFNLCLEKEDIISRPRIKLSDLSDINMVAKTYTSSTSNYTESTEKLPVSNSKHESKINNLIEKISSGKLNENFVTINLQKKKFSRGKKIINFSKYKKGLWKKKKDAIIGSEMDMTGCDGGVLKCFNCGETGHFANQCKINGDELLPLTATEGNISPCPTFDEFKVLDTELAVLSHSNDISQLPHAANVDIHTQRKGHCLREEKTSMLKRISKNGSESSDEDCNPYGKEEPDTSNNKYKQMQNAHGCDSDCLTTDLDIFTSLGNFEDKEPVGPFYSLNADGSVKGVTDEVFQTLRLFGHSSFRKGQDVAVMRILTGLSTLVTLSTGSGKSLCYQLPAYLYSRHKKCITLVISPLVSLMEDQVTDIPHFLRAKCLHTNQTPIQRLTTLNSIKSGEIDILLVSPEAVVAGERSSGFGAILRHLPPIAFACIDEAHCMSQWSHNFRPSYLLICKVLKNYLNVKTILGLTATASLSTRISIIYNLDIPDGEKGVVSDTPLPNNLILTVSSDFNRDEALLRLLLTERFASLQSIIIYCTRREVCERIAGFLRTSFQDKHTSTSNLKRKRVQWYAEPYHAGMTASRRRTVQKAFMKNELRIIVATIAFGMGINKSDIRAIIHYNMPRNFESYVQEIGRAGRDGKLSYCHLFLDSNNNDKYEHQGHIYANSIDRHIIRKLLQNVFVPCSCGRNEQLDEPSTEALSTCNGHEVGISIKKAVETLDVPEENIFTLLCYLELETKWKINLLSSAYMMVKIISYRGPAYLRAAAKACPPLAMAIAMQIKKKCFREDSNVIEFPVIEVASAIGWNSGFVKYQLKNLEWTKVKDIYKRSPITVSFSDLGFRLKVPGNFSASEIDSALDTLFTRSVKQEQTQLTQLQFTWQSLTLVSCKSFEYCLDEEISRLRSDQLKEIIRKYFETDYSNQLNYNDESVQEIDEDLSKAVHAIINMYPENNFSGRNIARIFHGLSAPNYPAVIWSKCKYWRAFKSTNFNYIVNFANTIILQRKIYK